MILSYLTGSTSAQRLNKDAKQTGVSNGTDVWLLAGLLAAQRALSDEARKPGTRRVYAAVTITAMQGPTGLAAALCEVT